MNGNANKPLVKICGLKDANTIRAMSGLPVDLIGLMFAASKRQVTPAQASGLVAQARTVAMADGRPPRIVGVFVDPTMDTLAQVLAQVPLDIVQLHGAETPAFCKQVGDTFGVEVWRVLSVQESGDADRQEDAAHRLAPYRGVVSTIMLDTAGGGTGRTFNWERIPPYQEAARRHGLQLLVAGGLTPDNVTDLIAAYRPDGVDVSSGVETDGVKNIDKIASFAERVYRS